MRGSFVASASYLPELIERLESGNGADRELDFAVGLASGVWKLDEPCEDGTRLVTYMHPVYKTVWHGAIGACIPSLTTSLDAVVSLIEQKLPGGTNWNMHSTTGSGGATSAHLMQQSGYAWTPARALLAACLRALSALEDSPAGLADAHSKSPSRPAMPKEEDTHG